jgi:hypothetical protein
LKKSRQGFVRKCPAFKPNKNKILILLSVTQFSEALHQGLETGKMKNPIHLGRRELVKPSPRHPKGTEPGKVATQK